MVIRLDKAFGGTAEVWLAHSIYLFYANDSKPKNIRY